ncbi:MAG: GNAT family N-acetyltransferase [Polyangiaceae bacterium]
MSLAVPLLDKAEVRARVRGRESLFVYELGDLDDYFFPRCRYFGHARDTTALALIYDGATPTTLLVNDLAGGRVPLVELVAALAPSLPDRVYAHLAPGLVPALADHYDVEPHGAHIKLARPAGDPLPSIAMARDCIAITPADEPSVLEFYREAYPGTWFSPHMLATGLYYGLREGPAEGSAWRAIAGVHVVSRAERVAALGNVATHPTARGRGLARAVCARVLEALAPHTDYVGLNVASDNEAALACYRSLGFQAVARYDEVLLTRRSSKEGSS